MGRKSRIILVVGIFGLVLFVFAGAGLLVYWGWGLYTDEVKEAFNRNPVIREHLGVVERIEIDLEATGDQPSDDTLVFRVIGSEGTGVVTADIVTGDLDVEEIRSGTLQLPTGETYDLMEYGPTVQDDASTY